jgi:hypothetical protein
MKLVASAILAGAGMISVALGEGPHVGIGFVGGLVMLIVGVVLFVRTWRATAGATA